MGKSSYTRTSGAQSYCYARENYCSQIGQETLAKTIAAYQLEAHGTKDAKRRIRLQDLIALAEAKRGREL